MRTRHIVWVCTLYATVVMPQLAAAESLVEKLLRISGVTASASFVRDGSERLAGNVWTVDLDSKATTPVTAGGGFSSPVFSPEKEILYALKGGSLVRIPKAGAPPEVFGEVPGVVKLVGVDSKDPDHIVLLLENDAAPLAVFSLRTRTVTSLAYDASSEAEKALLATIRGETRVLGGKKVTVKRQMKQGLSRKIEWTDVFMQSGDSPAENISNCNGVKCGNPAISPDGKRVAFVKED